MVDTGTSTQTVFQQMLRNVQAGVWETGTAIPSERTLIRQFGVSRIAIREALSMMRGLGGFVSFAQQESCRYDSARSQRDVLAHESIFEAIHAKDSARAKVEMEAHLRYSMPLRIDV